MKKWFIRFNIYLLALAICMVSGCQSDSAKEKAKMTKEEKEKAKKEEEIEKEKKKQASTLRLHLEVNSDESGRNGPVQILRSNPFVVNINLAPFLTEVEVERAWVEDVMGIPTIKVQFVSPQGLRMLDMITSDNLRQRIAVFSFFGQERWLAAPQITQRISDGVFSFTPDATAEETERIVRGLNNFVEKIRKKR